MDIITLYTDIVHRSLPAEDQNRYKAEIDSSIDVNRATTPDHRRVSRHDLLVLGERLKS